MRMAWAVVVLLISGCVQAASLHDDLPLKYLEQAQTGTHDRPLVIFLHGFGSNEADLFGIKDQLSPEYTYLSVQAPMPVAQGAWKWFSKTPGEGDYDGVTSELASSANTLGQFIKAAIAKYHTQADKVVLVGFSQGAIMSYEVALRHPTAVRGIAVLSGRLLPVLHSELKPGKALNHLAIFIGHGTDDPQLPVKFATQADSMLQALGVVPQVHLYPGMPHTISAAEIADLNAWLEPLLN